MNLIVAMTKQRVIGNDNKLLWHIPDDLKNFKTITSGCSVIMGRKTFESIVSMIGKPLPGRHNIVITRDAAYVYEGVDVCGSLEKAMDVANTYDAECFIIGGASVYAQALPYVDRMYISWVNKDYTGDAHFPEVDFSKWRVTTEKEFADFTFCVYEKVK